MNLSINFYFFSNFFNIYLNPYPKIKFFFLYIKFFNSKFARDLQNTQTQNPNIQKIEKPNPNSNLLVLLGAYLWIYNKYKNVNNIETPYK